LLLPQTSIFPALGEVALIITSFHAADARTPRAWHNRWLCILATFIIIISFVVVVIMSDWCRWNRPIAPSESFANTTNKDDITQTY
jgi:hypothetical protein